MKCEHRRASRFRPSNVVFAALLAVAAATPAYSDWAWQVQRIDSVGDVGRYTALAFDSTGEACVAYYDASGGNLKFAQWTGTQWNVSTIDTTGITGLYASLATDDSGRKSIACYDSTNGALRYVGYLQSPWTWSLQPVDTLGDVGLCSSLALDTSDRPTVSYYDAGAANLKVASWTGSSWFKEVVDTSGDVGKYSALAIDASNRKSVAYHDSTNGATKYAGYLQMPWSWNTQIVDSSGLVGQSTSLQFDTSQRPVMSYYDAGRKDLRVASWDGSSWTKEAVDTAGCVGQYSGLAIDGLNRRNVAYYDSANGALKYAGHFQAPWDWSIQTVDAAGNTGQHTSLALDTLNYPHISYYDVGNKDLKFAYHDDSAWKTEVVDSSGDVGRYSSLALDVRLGPGHLGYEPPSRGISYYDSTSGDLKFASQLLHDVGVARILAPDSIVPCDTVLQPAALVVNAGLRSATCPVMFTIGSSYAETVTVSLAAQSETTLLFPSWRATPEGSFVTRCTTNLAGDEVPSNNRRLGRTAITDGVGPEIYDISPTEGENTGPRVVNIRGLGFQDGITAALQKAGQPDIVADSAHVEFISAHEINATLDLTGAAAGIWDLIVRNPDGDTYCFYQGFTVVNYQGRVIAFGQWEDFGVSTHDSVELAVNVPSVTPNLFVLLKKWVYSGGWGTWSGSLKVVKGGNQLAVVTGYDDYGLHLRNAASGLYILKVRNADYAGQGSIKVCSALDTVQLDQWEFGRILRGYGSDWKQLTVAGSPQRLYLQSEGVGDYEFLDVYRDSLGSTSEHWAFSSIGQGTISGEISNPVAGTYYLKYQESGLLNDTSQVREYQVRASLDSVAPPPPRELTIDHLSTYRGGTSGPVTVVVYGTGFDTAAAVSLIRSGQPMQTASRVLVDSVGRELWATFNLASVAPGQWTFDVRNPNGDSAFAAKQFEVISGGEPQLTLGMIGRTVVRAGRSSTNVITCGNVGTVDAPALFLDVSTPHDTSISIQFPQIPYPPDSGIRWDTMDPTFIRDGTRTNPLLAFDVPPGYSSPLEMKLTTKHQGDFTVSAEAGCMEREAYISVHRAVAESLRYFVLADSSMPPVLQALAADADTWWRHYYSALERRGSLPGVLEPQMRGLDYHAGWELGQELFEETAFLMLGVGLCYVPGTELLGLGISAYGFRRTLNTLERLRREYERLLDQQRKSVASQSPEDKYGPVGFDPYGSPPESLCRFVPSGELFPYRVDFWNKESATAPAQDVFIKDTLSADFVDTTLNFTEFGFLRWRIPLNGGRYFNSYVDMRPDESLIVDVEGRYDSASREISVAYRSLDPVTMQTPEDPMAGFLPPLDSAGYNIGWLSFSARPRAGFPTGKHITNHSWVKFDIDPWKPAPPGGPYLNTIDAGVPTSSVRPLSETTATGEFTVHWTGLDDSLGSGVHGYGVYFSRDNGPYQAWLPDTYDTMATFIGANESRYRFYSVATDNVGWREAVPDSYDARTVVTGIAPPVYLLPKDSSLLNDAAPEFVWSATAGTYGTYTLQYSADSQFAQKVVTRTGLHDTTYTVPDTEGLSDSIYFWRVEAVSRLGARSGFRRALMFTLDAGAPAVPSLLYPSDCTITDDSTPTFRWTRTVGDSGTYMIQFAEDSSFGSLTGAALVSDTTYNVPQAYPLAETTHYWRVKATDKAGNSNGYQTHAFSVTIMPVRSVSGATRYYHTPFAAVDSSSMVLSGGMVDTVMTDSAGSYLLAGLANRRDYTVRPEKVSATREPAVSSYDAAMVLQHTVHRDTLDSLQFIAGDVSGDSSLSAYDAAFILRYAVGMIRHFPVGYRPSLDGSSLDRPGPSPRGVDTVDWAFRPPQRVYDSLSSDQANQDYAGILYGDPSGNWPGSDVLAAWEGAATGTSRSCFTLNLPERESAENLAPVPMQKLVPNAPVPTTPLLPMQSGVAGVIGVQSPGRTRGPVPSFGGENVPAGTNSSSGIVFPMVAHGARGMVSADALVRYDPKRFTLNAIRTTPATEGFMVAATDKGGYVRISMAGTRKLSGDVTLLDLVFEPVSEAPAQVPSLKLQASERDGKGGPVTTSEAGVGQRQAAGYSTSGAVGREPLAVSSEPSAVGQEPSAASPAAEVVWLVLNEGASDAAGKAGEGAMGEEKKLPTAFYLAPPKPNPFGDGTTFSYGLPFASEVRLSVFDVAGKRVRTLVEGTQPAGRHSLAWDGSDSRGRRLANGVYFIRMKAPTFQLQRKVTLLHR